MRKVVFTQKFLETAKKGILGCQGMDYEDDCCRLEHQHNGCDLFELIGYNGNSVVVNVDTGEIFSLFSYHIEDAKSEKG